MGNPFSISCYGSFPLRCGGPLLKGTQVYPRKFAEKVYTLHAQLKAVPLELTLHRLLDRVNHACICYKGPKCPNLRGKEGLLDEGISEDEDRQEH